MNDLLLAALIGWMLIGALTGWSILEPEVRIELTIYALQERCITIMLLRRSAPGRNRTCNLQIRSLPPYPLGHEG
jgi:hypothetical protein